MSSDIILVGKPLLVSTDSLSGDEATARPTTVSINAPEASAQRKLIKICFEQTSTGSEV